VHLRGALYKSHFDLRGKFLSKYQGCGASGF
jgi:hypothetical protein